MKKFSQTNASSVVYPLLFGLVILILWQTQVLHMILGTDVFTLPLPGRIIRIIADNGPAILVNVQATMTAALGGLFLGSLLGYLLGVLASVFPTWGAGGLTLVSAFNAVPIIAIAPILNNLTKDLSDVAETRSGHDHFYGRHECERLPRANKLETLLRRPDAVTCRFQMADLSQVTAAEQPLLCLYCTSDQCTWLGHQRTGQ